MADQKTGREVVAQSQDDSLGNTEPLAIKGFIGACVTAVLMYLVFSGRITEAESGEIAKSVEDILKIVISVAPLIVAALARNDVFSPRSAAKIAVENAEQPAGASPTLKSPP